MTTSTVHILFEKAALLLAFSKNLQAFLLKTNAKTFLHKTTKGIVAIRGSPFLAASCTCATQFLKYAGQSCIV